MGGNRWIGWVAAVLFLASSVAGVQAQERKMVRLQVSGSDDVAKAVRSFLTDPSGLNFLLGDDDAIPLLLVEAREKIEGTPLNSKVSLFIDRLEILRPNGVVEYASHDWLAYDYGEVASARQSAKYLLQSYFKQDESLIAALNQIPAQSYHTISKPDAAGPEELGRIRKELLKLVRKELAGFSDDVLARISAIKVPPPVFKGSIETPIEDRMEALARRQAEFGRKLDTLAREVRKGNNVISEAAVRQLQAMAARTLRAEKTPFVNSGTCPPPDGVQYKSVFAVVIHVPVKNKAELRNGLYGIYADNHSQVYPQNGEHKGPQVVSSLSRLKQGTMKKTFDSKKYYLQLTAVDYCQDDRAVILNKCDAEALQNASIRGNQPDRIFKDGRIYLIPQVRGDGGV